MSEYTYEIRYLAPSIPARDPEYTHEMDVMRYMFRDLLDAAATREQTIAKGVKVEDNKLVKADGWMPAGTHMPLGTPEPIKWIPLPPRIQLGTQKVRVGRDDGIPRDGRGSTLKQSIPEHSRRLPSRTLTWGPYAEWDNLEDA